MKKISSLLLALIACAGTIFAEKIQIGDLYYNLNANNKTAEVTYQKRVENYYDLKTVNIPESVNHNSVTYSVTSIGGYAFDHCSGLTSITIPNSVTSIGEYAFVNCSGLTSITIPNSVTKIGDNAFAYCSGLTSIEIPNSVTSIGDDAFSWCSGRTSIVVASGNTQYDSRDNCNAIIETSTNTLIAGCQNTIIPNSVTSIEAYAFRGCTGLTSITIPNSVTSIGNWAFEYCSGLTSVTNYATTPQTIESNVFYNVNKSSCTLYVPEGSIDLYKSAVGWKNFIYIQAIGTEDIDQIQLNSTVKNHKILYNGKVYIITGDKTYTVTGQQLK